MAKYGAFEVEQIGPGSFKVQPTGIPALDNLRDALFHCHATMTTELACEIATELWEHIGEDPEDALEDWGVRLTCEPLP